MNRPFLSLFRGALEKGLLLIIATVAAIIFANSEASNIYHNIVYTDFEFIYNNKSFSLPLHFIINDVLMSVFFLAVGIEIKKEMISGHLASRSQRVLPVLCAIFGVITPFIIYLKLNYKTPDNIIGWAIPTATDIAFTVAVMSMFTKKIPQSIRVFVTALAIIDDLIAVIAIAIFYTETLNILCIAGIVICAGILYTLNKKNVTDLRQYLLLGILMLILFSFSGIHTTISGIMLGFFLPIASGERVVKAITPTITYFIIPTFAFFNAGVSLDGFALENVFNPVISGVFFGLFLGKQIGIFGSFFLLVKSKIASMPDKATLKDAYIASILCGIGFTMSLFIAALAFNQNTPELIEAKVGILFGSLASFTYGCLMLYLKKTKV
jgi:NhaA family Na+:H+ antiporter